MEELVQNIVNELTALHEMSRTGQDLTQERIDEINNAIDQYSQDYFAIYAFLQIIRQHPDVIIRKYACTSMRLAFKYNWANNEKQEEILKIMFNILVTEQDNIVREQTIVQIAKLMSEILAPLVIQFARDSLSSGSAPHLLLAVKLIGYTARLYPKDESLAEFLRNLTKAAISVGQPELTLAAYNTIFEYYIESQADNNEDIQGIWQTAVELLPQYYADEQLFRQLCEIMAKPLGLGADFTPLEEITGIILELFNREGSVTLVSSCRNIIDALASGYPELMAAQEYSFEIYKRYCDIAASEFQPEETLGYQTVDIFEPICSSFALNPNWMEAFWQYKDTVMDSPAGQTIVMLTVAYTMSNACDFYENYLDDLAELIVNCINIEVVPLYESAVTALNEFMKVFKNQFDDYASLFEEALLNLIEEKGSIEAINVLDSIFRIVGDSDNIFERALNLLVSLLNEIPAESRYICVRAIANLSKNSQALIEQFASEVFEIVNMIIQADEEDEVAQLKPEAIAVLGVLIMKTPGLFESNANEIAEFIVSAFENNEDPSLVLDSLNAFGYLVNILPGALTEMIPHILEVLSALSKTDQTKKLVDLTTVLIDDAVVGDDDENALNDDKGLFLNRDELEVSGAATMLYGNILYNFTDYLQSHLEDFLNSITILTDSVFDESISFAMRALIYVIQAMGVTGFIVPEAVNRIFLNIHSAAESKTVENVSAAIECYAAIVCDFGLEHLGEGFGQILEILDSAVRVNLPCNDGEIDIPEDLQGTVRQLFREIFAAYEGQALPDMVLADINEVIIPLLDKDSNLASFALGILSRYIDSQDITDEFAVAVLEKALNVQLKFMIYEGFYLIKNLVQKKPAVISSAGEYLKQLFRAKFEQRAKTSPAYLQMKDNMVTAFGAVVMHAQVFTDEEVGMFFDRVLEMMPASVDHSEDMSMLEFFFWIAQRYQNAEKLAPVLIRFFALPKEVIASTEISQEYLGTLKLALSKLLGQLPNAQEFICAVCKNDELKIGHVSQALQ